MSLPTKIAGYFVLPQLSVVDVAVLAGVMNLFKQGETTQAIMVLITGSLISIVLARMVTKR